MPAKLEIDLAYLDQMSLWTDLRILALTVWAVFGKRMSSKRADPPR